MKAVETPPGSVLAGHGCVQHAGSQWRSEHCIRYQSFLVPRKLDLPDAIVSDFEGSLALRAEERSLTVEKGLCQQTEN